MRVCSTLRTIMHNSVSEYVRLQRALAPSKSKANFNTATAVYDTKTGKYYYGMDKGIQLSGDDINPTLKSKLPAQSLNDYKLGNCAECDAVNQALNDRAQWDI